MHKLRAGFLLYPLLGCSLLLPAPLLADSKEERPELEALRAQLERNEFDQVLSAARSLLGASADDPASAADLLDLMVKTYRRAGRANDPEARALGERAVRLREETAGPDDASVADSLIQLGSLLSHADQLEDAAAANRRALAIYERAKGPDDPKVASSLDNLADVLQKQAAFDEALAGYTRALRIREKVFGSDSLEVADTLYDMGNLGIRIGDYAAARERYDRALAIYTARREPGHIDIAWTKITLGYLLQLTGDLPRARKILEEAVRETQATLGPEHPLTANAVNNLGTVLYAMDDFGAALPVFTRALEIREKIRGPRHTETADAFLNVGATLRGLGRSSEALPYYERAMSIYVEQLGASHPRVAEVLDNIGNSQLDAGKLPEAVASYRRALEIKQDRLGHHHPLTAHSHLALAGALFESSDRAGALEHALEASRILNTHTRETVAFLPEREALAMVSSREKPEALLFLGLEDAADAADAAAWKRACWEWALRSHALVLDELARRNRAALGQGTGPAREAWEELARAREDLAARWVKGPGGAATEFDEALTKARGRKESAELALARLSAVGRREARAAAAGIEEVRAALPTGSVLLEYVRAEKGQPRAGDRPVHYFALVMDRNSATDVVDLGAAAEIDERVRSWRQALEASGRAVARGDRQPGVMNEVEATGARLRRAVWDPLAGLLDGAKIAFVVPDGLLYSVDFHALPAPGRGYLIEKPPALHLLDSAKDLLRTDDQERGRGPSSGVALLVGAPEFSAAAAPEPLANGAVAFRDKGVDCPGAKDVSWPELPETAREVETVRRLLGGGDGVEVLTGTAATESRLKRDAPGKRSIHLATHGFFVRPECQSDGPGANPLLRSGLILAGANRESRGGGEDGYLTSEEVAALDLGGVSQVVLSGCDTGLGEIESGEGVMGMRRSLAMAGAETVVMSLWRVPDRETRLWMTSFYESRSKGASVVEAIRAAGTNGLKRLRERDIPAHPYLWAGFVAAGDWR